MEIELIVIGRTASEHIAHAMADYLKRLSKYISFKFTVLPDIRKARNLTQPQQKDAEGAVMLEHLSTSDCLILLDEHGREYTSIEFSAMLQKRMASGLKRLVFAIGGPYGFSDDVYKRADGMVSLSRMTFNHEMVRLFFVEQVYRAMTILRGEPYHHQ